MGEPAAEAPASAIRESREGLRLAASGIALLAVAALLAWSDTRLGWVGGLVEFAAHQFYEVPGLAALRRPSQVPLVRMHLIIAAVLSAAGLLAAPRLDRHGR